jgi:hypothetical protein
MKAVIPTIVRPKHSNNYLKRDGAYGMYPEGSTEGSTVSKTMKGIKGYNEARYNYDVIK